MFAIPFRTSIAALALLGASGPAALAQSAIRGYPAGSMPAQTPYYANYYPVQYGYAYPPPAGNAAAAYQAAYPTVRLSPQTAYYAPATAAARPAANYTLAPAGGVTAGSEAFAYYGQSTPLNYVAPTYSGYQARMVNVPVTYYRPYTAYQPGVAAPVTCQRATTAAVCQPTTRRWCCCLDWLFHKQSCGTPAAIPVTSVPVAAVPAAVPQAVCYGNACAPPCGTPYYTPVPPANVVPGTTIVPGTPVIPSTPAIPSTIGPPRVISPIVPPPGTRVIPGVTPGTVFPGTTGDGADITPRITPGIVVPPPSTTFPGTGSGASFRPETERRSTAPISTRDEGRSPYSGPSLSRPTVSEPSLGPRRSVQPVPDPAVKQPAQPNSPANRAPQLIAPNDRTAAAVVPSLRASALGVIPAQWPEKISDDADAGPRGSIQPVSRHVPAAAEKVYDDSLWRSAAE